MLYRVFEYRFHHGYAFHDYGPQKGRLVSYLPCIVYLMLVEAVRYHFRFCTTDRHCIMELKLLCCNELSRIDSVKCSPSGSGGQWRSLRVTWREGLARRWSGGLVIRSPGTIFALQSAFHHHVPCLNLSDLSWISIILRVLRLDPPVNLAKNS